MSYTQHIKRAAPQGGETVSVIDFPEKPEPRDPLAGPFIDEYRIVVEGREIPLMSGYPKGEREGEVFLTVDRRFSISVPKELAYQVAWLVAQGIAVARGYPSLNAESKTMPFAPQVHQIDTLEP